MTSGDLARFIGKNRLLRRLAYWAIHLTTLREWYLKKALQTVLYGRSKFSFLDAGCGLGQHAIRIASQHPDSKVTAIDADKQLIDDCQDYADKRGLQNLNFIAAELDRHWFEDQYDVILCSSVLEHIDADDDVLSSFYRAMNKQGNLIVYVPLSEKRVLRSLDRKIQAMTQQANAKYPHEHVRYYTPKKLQAKLVDAGFSIKSVTVTYGIFGRWSYDLVTTVQYSRYFKFIFPFYLLFIHPFVLILMWLDTRMNNKEGNGLMIVAEKQT